MATFRVRVDFVEVAAFCTLGFCEGVDLETGERVAFTGDARPCREIAKAVNKAQAAGGDEDDLPVCEVEDWQLLGDDLTPDDYCPRPT